MKKICILIVVICIMALSVGIVISNAENMVKSAWHIDTDLKEPFLVQNGIHIEGWAISTEINTKIEVSIDGQEISDNYIKKSRKYDLISIVKGYGTYEENPEPNFDIDIPISDLELGEHILKIEFKTKNGEQVLQVLEHKIQIIRDIKHILTIDTNLDNSTFGKEGIDITGWKLATEADTKLIALIDGEVVPETVIETYYVYDLISIVKGYGTYKENPEPNYSIHIPTSGLSNGNHELEIKFVTYDNTIELDCVKKEIRIDKTIKHIFNIDTQLENQVWEPNGIQIDGWKLATEANTNIVIYINERKVEKIETEYKYIYDLISIVSGYGTYEENPTPNFSIYIPVTEFRSNDTILKLQMVSEQGEVLEERIYNIMESKTRIHIETPYDRTTITNEIHSIVGWSMTTASNTKVKLLIDGHYSEEVTRVKRQDVLNTIKDYGDITTNPKPGFDISIDFSKLNLGLHQIAIRVEKENGKIVGEQVIYIFLRQAIKYEEGTYGVSGLAMANDSRGSQLKYYRYGNGPNVFFATFAIHGFEDNWDHDGEELVEIANQFYEALKNEHNENYELANKWTIYILPELNPDGRRYGTTGNGPGRTTLYSEAPGNKGIDMNRSWKTTGFNISENSRNYAGTAPYQAYESKALRDFLIKHKSNDGQTVLVDLHGWYQQLVGNREVGMYYAVQFPENHGRSLDRYGDGYLIDWARTALASNGNLAKTSLIELPRNVHSHDDSVKQNLARRYIQATLSMLHGIV